MNIDQRVKVTMLKDQSAVEVGGIIIGRTYEEEPKYDVQLGCGELLLRTKEENIKGLIKLRSKQRYENMMV